MKNKKIDKIIEMLTSRIFIFSYIIIGLFFILFCRLYNLQIVNGEMYEAQLTETTTKEIEVDAPRGTIYDTYGRPVATNKTSYCVKYDPSVPNDDLLTTIVNLLALFEQNGEEYVDTFPISIENGTYEFMFDDNETKENQWKIDMGLAYTHEEAELLSAEDCFNMLCENFEIPEEYSVEYKRDILNFYCMIYEQRYRQYNQITLAYDVSQETIAYIEEHNEDFVGVYIEAEALRYYPYGIYLSHILGYTGKINQEEMEAYGEVNYASTDLIGKTGIEKSFEEQLRGEKGSKTVEVNQYGKRVATVEEQPAIPGDDIYLTIDAELQKEIYNIIEDTLTDVLISKLMDPIDVYPITTEDFFANFIDNNIISLKQIMEADNGAQLAIQDMINAQFDVENMNTKDDVEAVQDYLVDCIYNGTLSETTVILVMIEQGILSNENDLYTKVQSGQISSTQVLIDALRSGEITPAMTGLDPCTASCVVVDVDTGNVLAAVSYPSYDNNELVNNFNNEYYMSLIEDPNYPLTNRAFTEPRPPGSTFKMITAIAGLESGVITPTEEIYDDIIFTKAGKPYTSSWANYSFGSINVSEALMYSSNYFFCEVAYRLGNAEEGTTQEGIETLNQYMMDFGLDRRTGVEIGEFYDSSYYVDAPSRISSPAYKEYVYLSRDPYSDPTDYAWYDGDTVKTAIGQGYNNYTTANMCKYASILATQGTVYKFNLVEAVKDSQTGEFDYTEPVIEDQLEYQQSTWDAVYQGMYMVTEDSRGTAYKTFQEFPITIGAKTGTAQHNEQRQDHTAFLAFAPYDDPEIAVYVCVPYSDTKTMLSPASIIGREVIAETLHLYQDPIPPQKENTMVK